MVMLIKKIYTILVLIKNFIFRKKYYTLRFIAIKDGVIKRWYYDFKNWGFSYNNLEMVAGADKLCELYSDGKNEVTGDIIASKKTCPNAFLKYDFYEGYKLEGKGISKYFYGRAYKNISTNKEGKLIINTIWICPVTLFVLGRYPNCLYIKKNES